MRAAEGSADPAGSPSAGPVAAARAEASSGTASSVPGSSWPGPSAPGLALSDPLAGLEHYADAVLADFLCVVAPELVTDVTYQSWPHRYSSKC